MSKTFKRFSTCFVCLLIVCAIIVGVLINGVKRVGAENDKTVFSSKINALTNAYGETVNILPEDVRLWNESTDADTDYLNSLYEYSDLHKQFQLDVNKDNSNELLPVLYRQTDVFNPINNVLKWESSLENVESYKVRVSYDNKFTKCVLIEENADINKGVTLENPFTGTTYYWQVIATLSGGDKVYSQIFDFTTENTLRTVTVDGVSNTRDIGGYQTVYGYVKQGLVYRSARLESITEEGLDTFINKLGINTDLDLRGLNEANTGTNRYNPLKFESNDGYPNKHIYTYDTPVYTINNEALWPNVKNIMTVFTDKNNYPIDFHCAIGRDRTGTVAALLKSLLGYNEIDIINDYFTSMFATTGAWDKSASSGQKDVFLGVLSYLKSFSGETLADKTATYLITKCGMTQGDINSIRSIMTGKPGYEVSIPADNTTVDTDNYSGYNIVTCEKFGVKTRVFVVENGNKISAPFDAGDGYFWSLDGVEYDFNTIINNKDIRLIAQKVPTQLKYTVKIVSTGSLNDESSEYVNAGDNFDFALLNKSGYSYIVISAEGEIITSLKPESNTTINVIYIQS